MSEGNKYEGLKLLADAASPSDVADLMMLCKSEENYTEPEGTTTEGPNDAVSVPKPNGGISEEEAAVGIYDDTTGVAADDVSDVATPIKGCQAQHNDEAEAQTPTAADPNTEGHATAAHSEQSVQWRPHPPQGEKPNFVEEPIALRDDTHQIGSPLQTPPRNKLAVARQRPTTADKIRNRTNRLANELAEIEKFKELRTISNQGTEGMGCGMNSTRGHSKSRGQGRGHANRSLNGTMTAPSQNYRSSPGSPSRNYPILPPIKARSGGLFSETLARSKHTVLAGSLQGQGRLNSTSPLMGTAGGASPADAQNQNNTAGSNTLGGIKSQTRGDGRAGFSSKESRITGLVQQLSNKWGR